jgi:hypothetical protein
MGLYCIYKIIVLTHVDLGLKTCVFIIYASWEQSRAIASCSKLVKEMRVTKSRTVHGMCSNCARSIGRFMLFVATSVDNITRLSIMTIRNACTHRFKVQQMWSESSRFPGAERRDLEASIYRRKRYNGHSRLRKIFLLCCLEDRWNQSELR